MSAIYVNGLTQTYHRFLKSQEAKKTPGRYQDDSFSEKMAGIEHLEETSGSAGAGGISTQDMTMEEYRDYIYDQISDIPLHPSRMQDCIAIHISDAGFEAMKNDPEYEKWVLDGIRQDFGSNNPWSAYCGGNYCVKYFGATKEEYHGESWSAGYQNGNGKSLYKSRSEDSFWERRLLQKKRMKKWIKKQQEQKRLMEEAYEKAARKERAAHEEQLARFLRGEKWDAGAVDGEHEVRKAAQALAAYDLSLLMMDIRG